MKNTSVFRIAITTLLAIMIWMPGTAAYAQSVPEMVQAPKRAQGTWHSPSGRTTVSLDAEVIVPEVSSMPVVEVFPRLTEAALVRAMADQLIGEGLWQAQRYTTDVMNDNTELIADESRQPDYHVYRDPLGLQSSLILHSRTAAAGNFPQKEVSSHFLELSHPKGVYHANHILYNFQPGNNLGRDIGTKDAARQLANSVVQALFPDMQYHSIDEELVNLPYRVSLGDTQGDYGYRVYFARRLNSVPMTVVYQQGGSLTAPRTYSPAFPYEKLYVDVGQEGIFRLEYSNPLTVGDTLQPYPELLPFAQVLDIFQKVAPLKFAAGEQQEKQHVSIERIVLGYMHLPMKDHPDRYQMVPVWDFFRSRTIGNETYSMFHWSYFTINAIDGTVIDRDLGY